MTLEAPTATIDVLIGMFRQAMIEKAARDKTEVAAIDWTADTAIAEAGIDSFDFVELIFQVEEHFDVGIDYNVNTAVNELRTVGDLASEIDKLVAKNSTA